MAGRGLLNSNPYGGGLLGNPLQAGLLGQNALTNTYSQPNNVDRFLGGLTRLPFAIAEGIGNRVMQAHEAMPWGGGKPSAVGLYPDGQAPESYPQYAAGGMDPSVMVPFATDVAGMATTGSLAAPAVRNATGMGIRAYHGSPHDFDRFSMDKIGTGEGAQAYGHGLYFAENEGVAQGYKRTTAFADAKRQFLDELPQDADIEEVADMIGTGAFSPRTDELFAALRDDDWLGFDYPSQAITAAFRPDAMDRWEMSPRLQAAIKDTGRMYEVDINASPDEFLDWDKPLFKQGAIGERVRDVMEGILGPDGGATSIYNSSMGIGGFPGIAKGPDFAEALRAAGIKGIRYKDAGSRATSGGTSNYVVFDDNIIDILKKYGIAGLTAGGAGAAMLGGTQDASAAAPSYSTGGRF